MDPPKVCTKFGVSSTSLNQGYYYWPFIGFHKKTPDITVHMTPEPGQSQSGTQLNQAAWKTNPREPEKPDVFSLWQSLTVD